MMLARRRFLAFALAGIAPAALLAAPAAEVVLVTMEPDLDFSLASIKLRKLFLGFAVSHDGQPLRPIRNRSDEQLDQVFLQHVVAMSEDAYERRILSLSLQQGRSRPPEVATTDELFALLAEIPHSVSFCWAAQLADRADINVVKTLWRA